jgi:metal-responsive CopG/Arc/MetJ family transcriptional regulator
MAINPVTNVRKLVSLPRELVAAIEEYRFTNRVKTESEAIRRLIEAGLTSQKEVK